VAAMLVWGLFFLTIYLLRSFFLLIFLTFVFSYIQARSVHRLAPFLRNRPARVVIVALIFLSIILAAGILFVPKVKSQGEVFVKQFTTYIARVDQELFRLEENYPILSEILPELSAKEVHQTPEAIVPKGLKDSPTVALLQQSLGLGEETTGAQNVNQLIDLFGNIGKKIASAASAFLLSLLFSFLIVLDLPNLGRKLQDLENTKLWFIYDSVAGNIKEFSLVLGKALEAQLIIAIINSGLTAISMSLLGLGQHIAFLSVIVFLFSFFPVIGVFISSVPICLIALQSAGLNTMILAILIITGIHLIEGYVLNPRIYGSYMQINSVIVLIILTLGGKLFDFWGLLLGVPVCTYIFGYAIRPKQKPSLQGNITE
jgi:predicted PurR-regulated permease PerM